MKLLRNALLAIIGLAASLGCAAQGFPGKPIRVIVPYPPGGTIDALARALQTDLGRAFGQPVIVENKPGAGGRIGIAEVAKAPPDGHAIVFVFDSFPVDPIIFKDMPYDPWKDLLPVSIVARVPVVAVARASLPANDITELVAYAKKNPGKVSYGSVGIGSSPHLVAELFSQNTATSMLHVPYKGGANVQADLYGDNLDTFWGTAAFAKTAIASGRAKALGQAGAKRGSALPNVKTLAEQGFGSIEVYAWTGLMLPGATPPAILARWHAELVKVGRLPAVAARIDEQGWDLVLSTPDELKGHIQAEHLRWGQIIKAAKIPIQQ